MAEKRTVDEILIELVEAMDNELDNGISKELEVATFGSLKGNDQLTQYLRETMNSDIKRHFGAATDGARERITGHFALASYLLGKISQSNTIDKATDLHK